MTKTEFNNSSRSFHYCVPNSMIYIVDTLHFILIPHIIAFLFAEHDSFCIVLKREKIG